MKYIKFIFSIILITCFFSISTYIYASTSEDLTLSRIYVEPGNLEPEFSETRDYYTLILDPNVTNLIVQATPTNENLKYEIKGNENLKEGENLITITVYSKDNTKNKVYTINALKTNEPDKYNALLSTLIIDNYPFMEDFFPEKFTYSTKDKITTNTVDIFAYPQNSNANVKIIGNESLKGNEKNITITVTSENGLATRTYNIHTNKKIESQEIMQSNSNIYNISDNDVVSTEKNEFITFIITSIVIISILIAIILITKRK